jgi:hypothetical protein
LPSPCPPRDRPGELLELTRRSASDLEPASKVSSVGFGDTPITHQAGSLVIIEQFGVFFVAVLIARLPGCIHRVRNDRHRRTSADRFWSRFGPELCRVSDTGPLMIYPPVLLAGVRKPSGKEPAGRGVGGLLSMGICRGSVLGRGCTGRRNGRGTDDWGRDLSPRRPLAGCFWHDRGRRTRPGRPPVNRAAMPEARFPGRWVVR